MNMSLGILVLSLAALAIPCSAGEFLHANCTEGGPYSSTGNYKLYLYNLICNMTASDPPTSGYYSHSEGTGSDQVYGSYLCRGDLTSQNSSKCVKTAMDTVIANCSGQKAANVWSDDCIIKYSGQPFFGKLLQDYTTWCDYSRYIDLPQFDVVLTDTLTQVAKLAAADPTPQMKFATTEANLTFADGSPTLYTLAQCMPDLSPDLCLQCLNYCITVDLPRWCNRTQFGRTVSSSCFILYNTVPFYSSKVIISSLPPALPPQGSFQPPPKVEILPPPKRHPSLVIPIVGICTSAVILLALGMCYYVFIRKTRHNFDEIEMEEITAAESLQMDFNKIRTATQNFAPDKKLGQGGFGDVYKGKLENGEEIAVKRLTATDSGQGAAEFKNEVVLIAKLQHRNLVRLLGFCLSRKEKILVYEYLQNSSLDKILFDPIKGASLDWEKRFNIICGIAKGLLYLHEDSRLRIIHRDIKSSNILLDESMNPKISDFGIAKTLALDKTRASTEIVAGTYGYMAPEYVMTGQYSPMSDIYSFGIIVLEIVTGQKNRFDGRPLLEEALLHRAWRVWTESVELELIDSNLRDAYSAEEVVKCIHIGLLCIQEDPGKRPKMTSVVAALSGKTVDLPAPTPPKFFNVTRFLSETTSTSTSATSISTTTTATTQSSLLPNTAH